MDTQPSVPRLAYSIPEAEFASGLSRATLYRLMGRGELVTVKRGGRRLVPSGELERLCSASDDPAVDEGDGAVSRAMQDAGVRVLASHLSEASDPFEVATEVWQAMEQAACPQSQKCAARVPR